MSIVKYKGAFPYFFVIFLTSFLLGTIISFHTAKEMIGDMGKNGVQVDTASIDYSDADIDVSRLLEAYSYVKREYYDVDGIKKEDILESAIKGMIEGLGDKHSEYMTKQETKSFQEALSGDFEGIGAVVEKVELGVQIERILKGSPAKEFGLMKGDILIEANGIDLKDLNLYEAVENIKGPAGTKVNLKFLRVGEMDVLEKEVIRGKIHIPSVDSEFLNDEETLGYISINMFGGDTETEFERALDTMMDTKGIVIDLRDNGGGYLQSAVAILSNFIKNGKNIVFTRYRNIFDNSVYKSVNEGSIYEGKIVVLINGNSASASEITAGALSDYNKAIVVGEKSYGKGSVQQPFDLSGGGSLKITIARWYTPKNRSIDSEGIEPDVEILFQKEDYENEYDRQREEAIKVLESFIRYDGLQLSIDKYNQSVESDTE